jgi:hypothetical protein
MDRVANHISSGVTDVYDRHGYADEDKRIMAAVARHMPRGERRERGAVALTPVRYPLAAFFLAPRCLCTRASVLPLAISRPVMPEACSRRAELPRAGHRCFGTVACGDDAAGANFRRRSLSR